MNRQTLRVAMIGSVLALVCSLQAAAQPRSSDARDGQQYFLRYCASCHGVNGDGHGPVAAALSRPPANLRLLGEKYGMPLPASRIADLIDGRTEIRAHGNPEMPVWGERFYRAGVAEHGEPQIADTIAKIIAYLNTIQDRRTASR